jgi:Tfp pilus assembly protein PilN
VTQVNLLPREVKQRQTVRRRTGTVAVLGAAVVAAIIAFWYLQGVRLHKLDDQVAAQEATNATVQQQVSSLQKFADQKAAAEQQKTLLKSALVNTVRWSGVLDDLSKIEPGNMWLSSLTGTLTAPAAAEIVPGAPAPATGPTTLIGNIQFQGNSLDTKTIAQWLTQLEGVKGWVNSWLAGAQSAEVNGVPVWTFTSSIDLDSRAAHGGGTS